MRTFVFAALLALAQSSDGMIQVTVRDPDTRQLVPAVRVTVTLVPTQPTQPSSFTTTSFTDVSGFTEFKNLSDGVYNVRIEREGYAPAQNSGTSIFIREGYQQFRFEMGLRRFVAITGRVLKADGSPLAKAHVSPLLLGYRDGRRVLNRVGTVIPATGRIAEAYTNDNGEYRFEGLRPGTYYLRVDSAGFGGEDRDRDARITYYPGVSRSDDAVPVNPGGQDASGIDIRIPNTAVFTVSGTVSGIQNLRRPDGTDARPAAMPFYLVSSDADNVDDPDPLYLPNVGTENLGESRFELRGVAPGSYFLVAFQFLDRPASVTRVPLTVQDRDVKDLRLTLRPIPEVKGRIVIDGGASAIPQGPVGLEATPKERLPVLLSNTATRTTTQPTGEFTFPGLIEDIPYVPYVIGLPADAYVSDLRQRGLSVFNNGATIRSNPSDGPVEVHVALRGGTVQGIVRNATQGVEASVVLVPSAPRRDNPLLYREARTDESGRFVIRGVAPGEYKVFAWPESPRGRAYLNEQFLVNYDSRGVSVRINAATTSEVQVTVLPLP